MSRKAMDLAAIKIGLSPITGRLFIFRHGKDPQIALEKRPADADVMTAFVDYMMHDAPKGATQDVKIRDCWYTVSVKPRGDA